MTFAESSAHELKKLRGSQTLQQVADSLGISKSAWQMYETGNRVPRDELKIRIANHFGKTVGEIFFKEFEHK